ncbi:hypothetical protein Tcan_10167 [Toxocara canis]|uniref:Secreted protein n=2 Tax=Toxocara canis TaxID=6265 RepID=A0A0B2V271_TOXCA|nr:hypothetical protein Tcan_10167 [Toxocara canis]VDM42703.1 unnamed protein product [Toxocara canis]
MIFFVCSLVLSAVHYARRNRLATLLSRYFFSPYYHDTMLICRRIPSMSSSASSLLSEQMSLCLDTP